MPRFAAGCIKVAYSQRNPALCSNLLDSRLMELRGFCLALLAKRKANHLSRPGSSPAFVTHERFFATTGHGAKPHLAHYGLLAESKMRKSHPLPAPA